MPAGDRGTCYRGWVSDDPGLLETFDLLGETYQVQTEMVDVARGRLRTAVFCRGRVVAMGEATLHGGVDLDSDADSLQALLIAHHRLVISGFIKRTRGFEQRHPPGPEEAAPPAPPTATVDTEPETVSLPPMPEDPALSDGLDVRRLFGELRQRIERRAPDEEGVDLDEGRRQRLERARAALAWVVTQPQFRNIRLDEQARFSLLEERIGRWAEAGSNPDEAEWIWTEVVAFCGYVAEVNQRADLLEFDRRVVAWGRSALRRHGPDLGHLKPLRWLFGRDRELDRLLTGDVETGVGEWLACLDRLR